MVNRRGPLLLTAVLCASAACPAADAPDGVRIVSLADPACAEIHDAAATFLTTLGDGNVDAARAMFDGTADEVALFDAYADWVAAGRELHAALLAKFNEPDPIRFIDPAQVLGGLARKLSGKVVAVGRGAGDAYIAAGSGFDRGIGLRRVGGRYRVTHLAETSQSAANMARLFHGFAGAFRQTRAELDAHGFPNAAAAVQWAVKRLAPPETMLDDITVDHIPEPADAPVAHVADGPDLAALIGRPLASGELQAVIASLPETPRVHQFGNSLYIVSEAAGFDLDLNNQGVLRGVEFYNAGAQGHRRFNGRLAFGLAFGQTRRDVERAVGRPETSGGSSDYPYSAEYRRAGLYVGYAARDARTPDNPIHHMTVHAPEPAPLGAATRPLGPKDLAFRLVGDAGDTGTEALPDPNDPTGRRVLMVRREAVLDGSAVDNVRPALDPQAGKVAGVDITLTPDGGRRLEEATAANVGRQMAIVFDGRVLMAPPIHGKVGRNIRITIPAGWNVPGGVPLLAGRLHAAATALP